VTPIDHRIRGEQDGAAFLAALRSTCGSGDELGDYLRRNLAGNPHAWLMGFARTLQKALELGSR
jgi:hypothetical protein